VGSTRTTSIDRLGAVIACALCLATQGAHAQSRDDDARRRQLILQAGALRDRGDHEGALERLQQAALRRMSPSLRLFIAQEEQSLGRNLDGLRDARLCAEEFEADPSLSHRDEFLANCRALAEELATRVGRLTVRVPSELRGVTVMVRDEALAREAWNAPYELLPGAAVIEARAPGRVTFTREVTVSAGASVTVRVEMPSSEGPRLAFPNPPRGPIETPSRGGVGAAPWVLVGVGGASVVASVVLYALQGRSLDARDALCRSATGSCVVSSPAAAAEASAQQDRASTYNTVANITVGVGAACVVGGVLWWALGASGATRRAAVTVAPTGDGAVVGLGGVM
jgi:hypothetical protein